MTGVTFPILTGLLYLGFLVQFCFNVERHFPSMFPMMLEISMAFSIPSLCASMTVWICCLSLKTNRTILQRAISSLSLDSVYIFLGLIEMQLAHCSPLLPKVGPKYFHEVTEIYSFQSQVQAGLVQSYFIFFGIKTMLKRKNREDRELSSKKRVNS